MTIDQSEVTIANRYFNGIHRSLCVQREKEVIKKTPTHETHHLYVAYELKHI
jgi:hypothetical protein